MKAEVGGGVEELRTVVWVSGSHRKEPKMGSGWQTFQKRMSC